MPTTSTASIRDRVLVLALFFGMGLWLLAGCSREYSFEGQDVPLPPAQVPPRDTTSDSTAPGLRTCPGCSTNLVEGLWSVDLGGAIQCGLIDTAIVSPERNAFTFFGPSRCSQDSGLIISAWLQPGALQQDEDNLTTDRVSFYYYDNVRGPFLLQSQQGKPFRLTILRYHHSTRAAEGTFPGDALLPDGRLFSVKDGRWKTYLK